MKNGWRISGRRLFCAMFSLMIPASMTLADGTMPGMSSANAAAANNDSGADFFRHLFKVYMPRRMCMYYEEQVIWLHVFSDLLIAIAYYSIPFALVYFVQRRKGVQFGSVAWMFAAFILACGTTHVISVFDIWYPLYRVDGLVKAITAVLSIATAVALWKLMPKFLAIPSARELELTVALRTAELQRTNANLRTAEQERERLLKSERTARTDAERSSQLKDEFLATLSHELRTPLNAILGWSHILQGKDMTRTDLTEGLAVIERNARSQTQLIEDLLDMSRIITGKLRLNMERLSINDVVAGAVASARPSAEAKGVLLHAHLDPLNSTLRGDTNRLQQVVWNLLTNAIKFTPSGGEVGVTVKNAEGWVEIAVTDSGQGITPEFLPYVFERFRQADGSTKRGHGGLGIGLSIVKTLVEAHGGSVTASSGGSNQGATFTVRLPLRGTEKEAGMSDPTVLGDGSPAPGDKASLKGIKVLMVDDEPDAIALLSRMMRDTNAVLFSARSVPEALQVMQRERPDVLISDIGMPEQDGYDLIRQIRQMPSSEGGKTPAIALTAFARAEDRHRAILAGFQSHIAKPVEAAELIEAVASLTGKLSGI